VFLIAHKKWNLFEGRAQVSTWLYAIAYRVGCNYRRKAKRDQENEELDLEHEAAGPDPERSLLNKQAGSLVQEFCDSLSEKLRDVFVLCLIEERSVSEVADLLGAPPNTIYSRIRLVREAFRLKIEQSEAQL
jgi:RNA polymerase sigma-70 factor (ECF subfamily)